MDLTIHPRRISECPDVFRVALLPMEGAVPESLGIVLTAFRGSLVRKCMGDADA